MIEEDKQMLLFVVNIVDINILHCLLVNLFACQSAMPWNKRIAYCCSIC